MSTLETQSKINALSSSTPLVDERRPLTETSSVTAERRRASSLRSKARATAMASLIVRPPASSAGSAKVMMAIGETL